MDYAAALSALEDRKETRMVPDLSRILAIATYLDDPQLSYPTIHVTGTNGKGTAARVATEITCAHGLTTGLYTSPHLESVTERLSVCGVDITEAEFAEEFTHLQPFLELVDDQADDRVTYFEALTALAYLWFADKPVALGVFEVGMGGTWDATNLVSSDVAVVTPIGLDHRELGATLTEVAGEKAGIVKDGKAVIVREQDDEALAVLEARCDQVGATMSLEFRDWEVTERLQAVGGQSFAVRGMRASYEELFLPLFGEHAVRNAAAAIAACEALLGEALDDATLREALAGVRWPGRLEVVARHPAIVLDGAHNPAGAEALAAALREFFLWDRLHLVLSIGASKDVGGIAAQLAPIADVAYAARNESERTGDAIPIAEAFGAEGKPVTVHASVAEALDAARAAAAQGDLICVTGSLYTVADARRALGLTT
ncbi:MAG TPA: Mur ligase family protein [Actinomycetota bacterium]|nr:Mur ligase family protein [Actinomycetota bacterium]